MNAHTEFLKQYVLNRCMGNTGSMNGASVAAEAEKAWEKVQALAGHDSSAENDYEGMREFQAKYIRAIQELAPVKEELAELYQKHIAATKPNPALENVLAKLRLFIPFIKGYPDDDIVQMQTGCRVSIMTCGDLRRWIESEGK